MQTGRLLVADAHPAAREGLRGVLTAPGSGWEICAMANDGDEAVARAIALRPHVVLMDYALPGCDGLEAATRIRQAAPRVEVLLYIGSRAPLLLYRLCHSRLRGCLLKSEPLSELLPALDIVRRHHQFRSAALITLYETLAASAVPPALLSEREVQVLRLFAATLRTKEIATRLGISTGTVETHRQNLYAKLGCHNVAGLVHYAIEAGEIELGDVGVSGKS